MTSTSERIHAMKHYAPSMFGPLIVFGVVQLGSSCLAAEPPVARCKNVTLHVDINATFPDGPNCQAELQVGDIDDGSYDPDNDPFFLTFDPPGPFTKGVHVVTLTAMDNTGMSSTCTATVTIQDATPPVLPCPADIVVPNAPGLCSATVTWPLPPITDNCLGPYARQCTPNSGGSFAVGIHAVTCTGTDAANNRTTCAFTVTVLDTELPVWTQSCPSDITVQAEKDQPAVEVVFDDPVASDNCGVVALACEPPSGSSFTIGSHPVQCNAADQAGNRITCGFVVTVLAPSGLNTMDDLIEAVRQLDLPRGEKNSLLVKLRAASRSANPVAAHLLRAFANEVRAMKQSRRMDPAVADELIQAARDIAADLRSQ